MYVGTYAYFQFWDPQITTDLLVMNEAGNFGGGIYVGNGGIVRWEDVFAMNIARNIAGAGQGHG